MIASQAVTNKPRGIGPGPECCTNGVRGYGNLDADVMFVGIAPGKDEWTKTQRPFTGPSGQLLDAVLAAVGYPREKCYATNLICWWNDEPNTDEIYTCAPRLWREIEIVNPKLIIPLGVLASEWLTQMPFRRSRGAILDFHGGLLQAAASGATDYASKRRILCTYHPAAALHQDREKPEQPVNAAFDLIRDLSKIQDVLRRIEDPWPDITYSVVKTKEEAQFLLDTLPCDIPVALDIETDYDKDAEENNPFDRQIICAAISHDSSFAYVLPSHVLNSGLVWPTDIQWTFHHGQFDTIELRRRFGFWLRVNEDTMLQSYSLDERGGYHKLKPLSREYCLDADTKVLTTDLRWLPIGDVQVGDGLVGFDEQLPLDRQRRSMKPSIVESKQYVQLERYELTVQTLNGTRTVISSPLHGWLAVSPKGLDRSNTQRYVWRTTESLQEGDKIQYLVDPWEEDNSKSDYKLVGEAKAGLRFVGQIRPTRFFASGKAERLWNDRAVYGNLSTPAVVVSVKKLDDGELVGIRTSTKTFVAEGMLSHNSGADFYEEDVHKNKECEETYEYNAKDAVHTYRNVVRQHLAQDKDGVRGVYENIMIPAANLLARSQFYGIHADVSASQLLRIDLGLELYENQQKLQQMARDYGWDRKEEINPNSPKQLAEFLFSHEYLGLPVISYTKSGSPSTDKMVLQELHHEFVDGLSYQRLVHRMAKNYLVYAMEQVKYDGRFHPLPHIHGTTSGRLSYTQPAIQTLPKLGTAGILSRVRRIFSATNDEYVLAEFDYERMEGWAGAYLSEDDVLLEDLGTGDWHAATAEAFLGYKKDEVSEKEWDYARRAAKAVNYGTMYGETAHGLTRKPPLGIGCTVEEGQLYLNKWMQRYAKFAAWQKQQLTKAYANGELISRSGRKRRAHLRINGHQDRQLLNWEIQSICHEFTLLSAIELEPELDALDAHLLFIEHDALYLEIPKAHLQQVAELVIETMQKPRFDMPGFKVDWQYGPNLYDMVKAQAA